MVAGQFASAQTTISSGTSIVANPRTTIVTNASINNQSSLADFSNIDLVITGPSASSLTTTSPITLRGLGIRGLGNWTLSGSWTISTSLKLVRGLIIVPPTASLTYTGANDIATGSIDSYIEGQLFMQGTGSRTYPIGNIDGYFPVIFDKVTDATTLLGFEVIKGDPNLASQKPIDVSDIFVDHYWQFIVRAGNFSGSPLKVSTLGTDTFLQTGTPGAPVVLELDTDGNLTNIGGQYISPFVNVRNNISSKGKIYSLGKSEKVEVKVVNVITPTDDDTRNNVLQISDIELFPENKVSLLDRYGVPVKTWTNFKNFATTSPSQEGFDFATLGIGNYVCVVEYTSNGVKQKVSQMVTVLK